MVPNLKAIQKSLSALDISGMEHLEKLYPDEEQIAIYDKIRSQRVEIYSDLIIQQGLSQVAGVQRVTVLRDIFNFYAQHILDNKMTGANMDIEQQKLDISTMFVFSHSFLQKARELEPNLDPRHQECVDAQYNLLQSFKAASGQREGEIVANSPEPLTYSPSEIISCADKFENVTLDVANHNLILAQVNMQLFDNISCGLYFWIKNAKENEVPGLKNGLLPVSDMAYENELLGLALQRVESFAKRAQSLYTLSEKIVETSHDYCDGVNGVNITKGMTPPLLP
jgi:hypothetical protein